MAATNDSHLKLVDNISGDQKRHQEADDANYIKETNNDDVDENSVRASIINIIHSDHSECADLLTKNLHLSTRDQDLKVKDLVVVDADFSLTASLTSIGCTSNIVPESRDRVMKEDSEAEKNVEENGRTFVQERVDAHNMKNQNLCIQECEQDVELGLCNGTNYKLTNSGEIYKEVRADQNKENDDSDDKESSAFNDEHSYSDDHKNDAQQSSIENYVTEGASGHHQFCTENDLRKSVATEPQLNTDLIDHDDKKCDVIAGCLTGSCEDNKIERVENNARSSVATEDDKVNDADQPILANMETRCIGHYNNGQKILLVGEGDFSFASSLATAFGYSSNLTATSLDSRVTVIREYSRADKNLIDLAERGAVVVHNVDVHTMNNKPELKNQQFDRIVFNFPHAGGMFESCKESDAWYIETHQHVVKGFFMTASNMLSKDGEIHVTHKTTHPFDTWDIVGLARLSGLELTRKIFFNRWVYPGYENKKAYMQFSGRKYKKVKGSCWDSTFPVGECSTFMFSKP